MQGNESAIRQIVTHLLGNALKFTDSGQVALHTRAKPGDGGSVQLAVQVQDSGPGIAPALRAARRIRPFQATRLALVALLATAVVLMATPAQAGLNIVFNDGGRVPMSALQLGAFQAAGNHGSGLRQDDVTVYLDIGFDNLPAHVLGNTDASLIKASDASLRSQLASDARSALDHSAVSHLQAGPALVFQASQGDLSTRLDNDGSANNRLLILPIADATALGLATHTHAGNPDGTLRFNTAFASSFAYTRDSQGQVPALKSDVITVAEHAP